MSNTRKIDLAKLAAALTGQQPAQRRPQPSASVRTRPAFPRVSADRIEELLDGEPRGTEE